LKLTKRLGIEYPKLLKAGNTFRWVYVFLLFVYDREGIFAVVYMIRDVLFFEKSVRIVKANTGYARIALAIMLCRR